MAPPSEPPPRTHVPFAEAFRFWLKLGFINFGGPTGQIALMHAELVERRRWIDEARFLHALNYCMLLPGPEAQQLAIYVGWLLHGARGGMVAGLFFVLPAFFLLLGISAFYVTHGTVPAVAALFLGLRAAVVAVVAAALVRIARKTLSDVPRVGIAAASFLAIAVLDLPFPAIVALAALAGWALRLAAPPESKGPSDVIPAPRPELRGARRALRVLIVGLVAWWGPLLVVAALLGPENVVTREALFFSQAALVTFGGAYAVLAYVNQAVVSRFGWLASGQMMDGLALAESTPGPLIMVLEFVGFVAAFQHPGGLHPMVAGLLGATVAAWATFAPCFLWIFLGAPHIEALRGHRGLTAALSGITAAVVGVILNLSLVLAQHTFFDASGVWQPLPTAIAVMGFFGLFFFRWPLLAVMAGGTIVALVAFSAGR
jgi:chromate transporter